MINIKNKREIEGIRTSCQKLAETLTFVKETIKEGMTTLDLDTLVYNKIVSLGAKPAFLGYNGFPNSICASTNEVVIHGIPNTKPLKDGDIVGIDCGLICDDFYSDMAYTFTIGNISKDIEELLETTKDALFKGIETIKVGSRVRDISEAIGGRCHNYGVVREYTGHGVGLELHEEPNIPNYSEKLVKNPRIQNGMVFAIEPMVNLKSREVVVSKDGWSVITKDKSPSAHFEHTIIVFEDKVEIATQTDWF